MSDQEEFDTMSPDSVESLPSKKKKKKSAGSSDLKEYKNQRPKRVVSRFFNALLALVFFVLFIMSVVSFSSFSHVYRRLKDDTDFTGTCPLNVASRTQARSDGSCRVAIGGEVIIAIYALLSVAVMIIKICGGWSMMSCFLIFELLTVIVMILLSFSVSVVISVGRSLTCSTLSNGCSKASTIGSFHFYDGLQVAEATAWLGFAILVGILVFYVLCVIMYCYGRRQAKKAQG